MTNKNFWDLTNRPYTQLKLRILEEYLQAWAQIFFSAATKHKDWKAWQTIYYIDCFAGRGKYHKDGKDDVVNGSPLIALECAQKFNSNPSYKGVKMHCIFIENKSNVCRKLIKFCEPYKDKTSFEIYEDKDFNSVIGEILNKTNSHPSFFFIDPDGIRELKKESVESVVNRRGPTDILLNYIKGGVERIVGLAKKQISANFGKEGSEKYVKTINRLTDFY